MKDENLASHSALLNLDKLITKTYSAARAQNLKLFARQYFASTSRSELQNSATEVLFASLKDAWDFVQQRKGALPKIEIHDRTVRHNDRDKHATFIYVLANDKPFIVDSLRNGINQAGIAISKVNNAVLHVKRVSASAKQSGRLKELHSSQESGFRDEALCVIQCGQISEQRRRELEKDLKEILKHVRAAVKDYSPICRRVEEIAESLAASKDLPVSGQQQKETVEFLNWLVDNHFTFLGYEEYRVRYSATGGAIELQEDSLLGVSRFKSTLKKRATFSSLPDSVSEFIQKQQLCSFAKSGLRSKVHRPVYLDYVLVGEFDSKQRVIRQHRLIGLYTSSVYFRAVTDIPLLRRKVKRVLQQSAFAPGGHSSKDLLQVINQYPRDELFQISGKELLQTAVEIARVQDTKSCRLFIRRDLYGKFFSCLVYIPRDNYNTDVRLAVQRLLEEALHGEEVEFNTFLSESVLVRVHFVLRAPEIYRIKYDRRELEQQVAALIKPWSDELRDVLSAEFGDSAAFDLMDTYGSCFTAAYQESYSADVALADLQHVRQVEEDGQLALKLRHCQSSNGAELGFKIFSRDQQLFLSNVDPILENLGLKIISEKAFPLEAREKCLVWLHDFSLYRNQQDDGKLKPGIMRNFEDAFRAVWEGRVNDDGFNALVISARLDWRDAALLRAYAAYLKQIQFGYSADFIAETLSAHNKVSSLLRDYFYALFAPADASGKSKRSAKSIRKRILGKIDAVTNLSEDSVLRAFLNLIDATQRTNYFQRDSAGNLKDYFSFKFKPESIEGMPLPRPKFEIFVFSRQMEGVHLRGGNVARGGLRWSDRSEDYRTEVLGLVKAQQVKNSVIVPVGAKGCFVVKASDAGLDRDQKQQQGISCYETFISGLLDLTDNLVDGAVVPPPGVVRRDEDDPYLVVAADKGTATFSDIANKMAAKYNFWLGDGFASGGSNGYDHKAMGITARGAWVSVQRHFREMGVDVQLEDFTVVGIGDMSGDVFGNGMLLSEHICLVAAFNHLHIFIDPSPDAGKSFKERQRLFKLPRSNWADYKKELISKGGGVFERTAKSITLTAEMQERFHISAEKLTPDQLIKAILQSPVDLIWNGGIGTYAKASHESHADVGDKANDSLRVDAKHLRCRVIGEGGNLGITQDARIEFAQHGGTSLTDFIDNSAGVDCSDHEVNIKILLNGVVDKGSLTTARRNNLLEAMTEEVAGLVLDNNYSQVQAISVAHAQMQDRGKEFGELINFLEQHAGLNRELENLPNREELEERMAKEMYLTRPEIAVLTSYIKIHLKAELPDADYIDDPYLESFLLRPFPARLQKSYREELRAHPLRKRIVATQIANMLVNRVGPSFIYRMADATGTSTAEVVRIALIALDVFDIEQHWDAVEALDYEVPAAQQIDLMSRIIRLVRRVTRWMLRHHRDSIHFGSDLARLRKDVAAVRDLLPSMLPDDYQSMREEKIAALIDAGVPAKTADNIATSEFLFPAVSFIDISSATGESLETVIETYYSLSEALQLNWLGKMINQLSVSNYWQALARETFLDDLSRQQQALCINLMQSSDGRKSTEVRVESWLDQHEKPIERVKQMLKQLQSESQADYPMFSVSLRELSNLSNTTIEQA